MEKLNILLIILVFSQGINECMIAQDFSEKKKMIIYSECQNLLNDYQQLVNQLSESGRAGFERSVGTIERLMELFINRKVLIYNDLDPQHKLSEYYELETYTSNMVLWYPDGIQIALNLKNAKTSDIRKHDEGLYSTDIMVIKIIRGNYLNESINSNTEELIFRIAFAEQNNKFKEFKIAGVRNSKSAGFAEDNKALFKLKSIDLSANEKEKVRNDIRQVLDDYQRSLILLGDPNEKEEDKSFYKEAFLNLFSDSTVKIYNDIEEKPEKTIISVEEYLNNFREYYPEGIKNLAINIDTTGFGNVIPADDDGFYCYIYADKFFSGKFRDKNIYRLSASLVFKISFEKTGNLFTGFKIENIDRSGLAFFQQVSQAEEQVTPSNIIQPISRKGFYLSPYVSAGYSSVMNKNISSLVLETNDHEWQIYRSFGFSAGLSLDYFFGNHIGLNIGAGYGQFSSVYSLHGNYNQTVLSFDMFNEPFYKQINSIIDSTVKLSYLQLSFQLIGLTNQPQRTGLYCKAGIITSALIDGKYDFSGDLYYWGSYPEHPVSADSLLIPELGFYKKTDHSGDVSLDKFFLSGTFSIGINVPVSYFTTIQFGVLVQASFMDISKKADYTDIFGIKYAHKPVSLNYLGLEMSIRFK